MPDISLENELWDDDSLETGPIFHHGCGGRVYWIHGEEFRCLKCCERVAVEKMEIALDGQAANQK
jgi:hypothetical protein